MGIFTLLHSRSIPIMRPDKAGALTTPFHISHITSVTTVFNGVVATKRLTGLVAFGSIVVLPQYFSRLTQTSHIRRLPGMLPGFFIMLMPPL